MKGFEDNLVTHHPTFATAPSLVDSLSLYPNQISSRHSGVILTYSTLPESLVWRIAM